MSSPISQDTMSRPRKKILSEDQEKILQQWLKDRSLSGNPSSVAEIKEKLRELTGRTQWNPSEKYVTNLIASAGVSKWQLQAKANEKRMSVTASLLNQFLFNVNHWPLNALYQVEFAYLHPDVVMKAFEEAKNENRAKSAISSKPQPTSIIFCVRADGFIGPYLCIPHHPNKGTVASYAKGSHFEDCIVEQRGVTCDCEYGNVRGIHECHWNFYVENILVPLLNPGSAVIMGSTPFQMNEITLSQIFAAHSTPLYINPLVEFEISPLHSFITVVKRHLINQIVEIGDASLSTIEDIINGVLARQSSTIPEIFRHFGIKGSEVAAVPIIPVVPTTELPFQDAPQKYVRVVNLSCRDQTNTHMRRISALRSQGGEVDISESQYYGDHEQGEHELSVKSTEWMFQPQSQFYSVHSTNQFQHLDPNSYVLQGNNLSQIDLEKVRAQKRKELFNSPSKSKRMK